MLRDLAIAVLASMLLLGLTCRDDTYSIPLRAGLNQDVTYPGATMDVEDAVASMLPALTGGSVQYWDGSAWLVWTPDAAYDTLLTLEHGKAYALTLNTAATWTGKRG